MKATIPVCRFASPFSLGVRKCKITTVLLSGVLAFRAIKGIWKSQCCYRFGSIDALFSLVEVTESRAREDLKWVWFGLILEDYR